MQAPIFIFLDFMAQPGRRRTFSAYVRGFGRFAVALWRKMVYTVARQVGSTCAKREVFFMLTIRGIITLLILVVAFAVAVVWISKQGGWKGEGCGGNCASCHQHCDTPKQKKQ